ncbi:cation diffusion facilitator family transporter [Methanofollis sp. W23]|uniref:cation diffusion facilitator family transporter n=1 Tax=Methanofollis sp. W23 TaxID=2817849 RepID=UPI001AE3BC1A|nr:cation diffusion facilitator family transporter [Methanofollis sp. W23]MBP2145426.1 cation diffusion facilitator family transporter [Methanofollis sp. W23]
MGEAPPHKDRQAADAVVRQVALISLAVNVGLVLVKLLLARVSGSLALGADAVHSSLDVLASLALLAGIWLSSRTSREFPYGLYKVENLVAVAIALLVFFTAWEIAATALAGEATPLPFSGWVLVAVAALVSVPYVLGTYEVRMGTVYHSPSLVADGKQHRVDVLSTSVVFFALLGRYFGLPLDHLAALVVAVFIAYSGWGILKDSMRTLLDASIDHETRDVVRAAVLAEPMVTGVKDLTGRNSGRYIFVEASVVMKPTDLAEATRVGERIQARIRDQVPNVERVVIHPEPGERSRVRCAVPLSDLEGTLSSHFGEAPYFALLDFSVKEGRVQRKEILSNPAREMEKQKGLRAAEMLLAHKPDIVYAKQSFAGKSPEYVFESARIEMRTTRVETLRELTGVIEAELAEEGDRTG